MPPPHDISPSLNEQLILELEGWIAVEEAVDVFPGGQCSRFVFPVHENLANILDEARAGCTFWFEHRIIMVGRRQRRWCSRRGADQLLQELADQMVLVPKGHGEGRKVP